MTRRQYFTIAANDLGVQAGSPDQGPVDSLLGRELVGGFGFDRAAVEDTPAVGELLTKGFGGFSADKAVGIGGQLN